MSDVPIKLVAEALGVTKDYALRLLKRRKDELGIKPISGKRNAIFLSRKDADRLIDSYEPHRAADKVVAESEYASGFGYFYVIQLHPDDLPSRLKVGYTDNLDVRLADHRTTAPTLKLLAHFSCKRTWEDAVRSSITREGCQHVGGEVYDADPEELVRRAEAFFQLMPRTNGGEVS